MDVGWVSGEPRLVGKKLKRTLNTNDTATIAGMNLVEGANGKSLSATTIRARGHTSDRVMVRCGHTSDRVMVRCGHTVSLARHRLIVGRDEGSERNADGKPFRSFRKP